MREIRTFEMEYEEPAVAWRIASPLVVTVTAGQLWLTVERDSQDYWLEAGQSLLLPFGARVWLSAGRGGACLTAADASRQQAVRPGRAWIPRRLHLA